MGYGVTYIEVQKDNDDLLRDIPVREVVRFHGNTLLSEFDPEDLLEEAGKAAAMKHFGLVEPEDS